MDRDGEGAGGRRRDAAVPAISRPVLWYFRWIARGYFRRHFRAVRIQGGDTLRAAAASGRPVLVYANHVSWWDPMVQVLLGEKVMPERKHFAPMDAAALARYGIFQKIGVFGVEQESRRGASQFLRTGLAVLESGGVLWVTPQGRFADVRERPVGFKPGLAALAARVRGGCLAVPLAIEYAFWDERLPECLLRIGEPMELTGERAEEVEVRLREALERTMDELAGSVTARDAWPFETLFAGRVGAGGYYQFFGRIWAGLRGRRYQAEHTVLPGPESLGEPRG